MKNRKFVSFSADNNRNKSCCQLLVSHLKWKPKACDISRSKTFVHGAHSFVNAFIKCYFYAKAQSNIYRCTCESKTSNIDAPNCQYEAFVFWNNNNSQWTSCRTVKCQFVGKSNLKFSLNFEHAKISGCFRDGIALDKMSTYNSVHNTTAEKRRRRRRKGRHREEKWKGMEWNEVYDCNMETARCTCIMYKCMG